jgi:hypothetical protein
MSMLAGRVDVVIGVDTHRDSNTAAIVDAATTGVFAHAVYTTDAMGYKRLLGWANKHGSRRRVCGFRSSSRRRVHPPRPRHLNPQARQASCCFLRANATEPA